MTVTQEGQGRLNAFANEPKIEVITNQSSDNKSSWVLIIGGLILIIGLVAFSVTIK